MTRKEAIFWLQAILNDTLDPRDETDAKRIEAVEVALGVLKERTEETARPVGASR